MLSGKLSSDNTVRLYKTDLSVAAGSKVELTYNKLNSDDSKLQLGSFRRRHQDYSAGGHGRRWGKQRLEDRNCRPLSVRG